MSRGLALLVVFMGLMLIAAGVTQLPGDFPGTTANTSHDDVCADRPLRTEFPRTFEGSIASANDTDYLFRTTVVEGDRLRVRIETPPDAGELGVQMGLVNGSVPDTEAISMFAISNAQRGVVNGRPSVRVESPGEPAEVTFYAERRGTLCLHLYDGDPNGTAYPYNWTVEVTDREPQASPTPDQSTPTVRDTDGDGVPDDEDYAPKDPAVQEKRDLETNATAPPSGGDRGGFLGDSSPAELGSVVLLFGLLMIGLIAFRRAGGGASGRHYVEASAPLGLALVLIGGVVMVVHSTFGIFTSWTWAILFGSVWIVLGGLLLFPDVRLYQYDQSPLEQILIDYDDRVSGEATPRRQEAAD